MNDLETENKRLRAWLQTTKDQAAEIRVIEMAGIRTADDIRSLGSVEVKCVTCGWCFWMNALDKRLPDGPFLCAGCAGKDICEKEKDSGRK